MIDTTEASAPATGPAADEETETRTTAANGSRTPAHERPRRPAAGPSPANMPRIVRPQNLPRAARPVEPPSPEHHHLPGWVRRVHGQARPILADLLGGLNGTSQDSFQQSVDQLVAGMSAGRFSLAWNYPKVIDEGMALFEDQRQENAEAFAAQRALDARRRKASDALREAGTRLQPDVIARLNRTLRNAADAEEIDAVAAEIEQSVTAARSNEERRRDREIDRTRTKIRKSMPRATTTETTETWQDVLRRFAESQASE